MKFIKWIILFSFCFSVGSQENKIEMGRFVKDIIVPELKFEIPKIQPEALSQNLVLYSSLNEEFPIVYLDIHFYAGESSVDKYPIELVNVLADAWKFGGSQKYPESTLIENIEALGAKLNISSNYNKTSISLSYLTKDEKQILEYLEELILNPALSEKSIQNSKKKIIESIARRNERTESIGFRKAREWAFRGFKRGIVPQKESVEKISKQMILDFFQDMIKTKKKAIVLSGNFDPIQVKTKLIEILENKENLPSKFVEEKIDLSKMKTKLNSDKRKEILISKPVNQSMILYFGTIPQHNHPDFFAIQLLNYIIGGGGFNSYLMQQIREERGLAYSAASYPVFEADYGLIYFYTLTKNESMQEADNLMKKILSVETFLKIKDEELENAKNAIINQFVFLFDNKHSILSAQLGFDEDKMPKNYLEIYRDKMREVTLEDLKRVGLEYFDEKKLKRVYVSSKENLEKNFPNSKYLDPEDLVGE